MESFFQEHPRMAFLVAVVAIVGIWTMDAIRAWAAYDRWSSENWIVPVVAAALAGALALPLLSVVMRPSLRYDDMAAGSLGPIVGVAVVLWFIPFASTHHRTGSNPPIDDRWDLAAIVFSDVFVLACAIAVVWILRRFLAGRAIRAD